MSPFIFSDRVNETSSWNPNGHEHDIRNTIRGGSERGDRDFVSRKILHGQKLEAADTAKDQSNER
jgi:hypothetical protein